MNSDPGGGTPAASPLFVPTAPAPLPFAKFKASSATPLRHLRRRSTRHQHRASGGPWGLTGTPGEAFIGPKRAVTRQKENKAGRKAKQAQKEQKCVVNNTEREKGQKTRQAGKQSRHKVARCGGYVW